MDVEQHSAALSQLRPTAETSSCCVINSHHLLRSSGKKSANTALNSDKFALTVSRTPQSIQLQLLAIFSCKRVLFARKKDLHLSRLSLKGVYGEEMTVSSAMSSLS
jgi:hypothetical protein